MDTSIQKLREPIGSPNHEHIGGIPSTRNAPRTQCSFWGGIKGPPIRRWWPDTSRFPHTWTRSTGQDLLQTARGHQWASGNRRNPVAQSRRPDTPVARLLQELNGANEGHRERELGRQRAWELWRRRPCDARKTLLAHHPRRPSQTYSTLTLIYPCREKHDRFWFGFERVQGFSCWTRAWFVWLCIDRPCRYPVSEVSKVSKDWRSGDVVGGSMYVVERCSIGAGS